MGNVGALLKLNGAFGIGNAIVSRMFSLRIKENLSVTSSLIR